MEVGVPSVFYQLIVRNAKANPTALRPPCLRASLRAGAYLVITALYKRRDQFQPIPKSVFASNIWQE